MARVNPRTLRIAASYRPPPQDQLVESNWWDMGDWLGPQQAGWQHCKGLRLGQPVRQPVRCKLKMFNVALILIQQANRMAGWNIDKAFFRARFKSFENNTKVGDYQNRSENYFAPSTADETIWNWFRVRVMKQYETRISRLQWADRSTPRPRQSIRPNP